MLQKKEYQQQQTPTKTNATKEVQQQQKLPVAPTKTNATKEGVPAATKIPVAPTKTNATKEGRTRNKVTSSTYKN